MQTRRTRAAQPAPNRRELLLGAGALTVVGPRIRANSPRDGGVGPNILFLISDQHRASVAGYAGDPLAQTPSLDRLAREGTRFDAMYCQAPVCAPARQSLVTGKYAHVHATVGNRQVYDEDQWTLAGALAEAGYDTAFFGKSHCNTAGFKTVRTGNDLKSEFRASRPDAPKFRTDGPEMSEEELHGNVRGMNPRLLPPKDGAFQMEEHVSSAVEEFLRSRSKEKPFFIWASYLNPHPPLFPPQQFLERFAKVELPTFGLLTKEAEKALFRAHVLRRREFGVDRLSADELLGITRAYYAALAWTDHCIGRVLDVLDELELGRETLVVYTSDHGEMLGEHGLLQKRCMFEGAARIPCIVRQPGWAESGAVVERVTQHVDVTASILAAAGATAPADLPGRSILPFVVGSDVDDWTDYALCEMQESGRLRGRLDQPDALYRMLRVGHLKYVRYSEKEQALFDVREDPGETANRIRDPKLAGELTAFRERLAALPTDVAKKRRRRER